LNKLKNKINMIDEKRVFVVILLMSILYPFRRLNVANIVGLRI
jgi:hypothetical protein